jgi:hypothetical protein
MPRTDTSTIRCTPAFWPISCRLWAEAVKNSLAALGARRCRPLAVPLAASMTHSAPVIASPNPSPLTTSTPVDRDIATTPWPHASSTSTTRLPTLPVAPPRQSSLLPPAARAADNQRSARQDPRIVSAQERSRRAAARPQVSSSVDPVTAVSERVGVRCASKSGQLLESTSCVVGFYDPSVGGFPCSRRPLCDR